MLLGYKKNGRPRALWDVVKDGYDIVENKGSKGKKKNSKNKKKRHKKESSSLEYFYKNAFDVKKMDW